MSAWVPALFAVVLAAVAASAYLLGRRRLSPRMRERLAMREDVNGRALLGLAAAIEDRADVLARAGLSAAEQRAWVSLCKRAAVEHLACINVLLLEPDTDPGLMGADRARTPPGEG